ncbi:MAG: hypothetical protein VX313_04390 [Bacteroidota bacterium]|nr:hypothetical protein [Bacteroidota bacterium]
MIDMIIVGVVCFVVGIGGTLGVQHATKPKPELGKIEPPKTAEKQQEVILQLTDLDIIKPICTPDYIERNSDLLCRSAMCLQFTRGIDSQTNGKQCESISNIQNKIAIQTYCTDRFAEEERQKHCIELFWQRD